MLGSRQTHEPKDPSKIILGILGALLAICSIIIVQPQSMIVEPLLISLVSDDILVSLEKSSKRSYYVSQSETVPVCPGENCPLNLNIDTQNSEKWYVHTGPHESFQDTATTAAWQGHVFTRYETTLPKFAQIPGDLVAFDVIGIAGKKWRLFVNGVQKAEGRAGVFEEPIIFSSDGGIAGTKMVLGFDIDAGKALSPGIVSLTQPFLSVPAVAQLVRSSYRNFDRATILPLTYAFASFTILAALGCVFTPFALEVFAFALTAFIWNYTNLLTNNFTPFPMYLGVDFVTIAGTLRLLFCASLATFYVLYFRSKKAISFVLPLILLIVSGLTFLGSWTGWVPSLSIFAVKNYYGYCVVVIASSCYFSFKTWQATRGNSRVRFRNSVAMICFLVGLIAIPVMIAKQLASWHLISGLEIMNSYFAKQLLSKWVLLLVLGFGLAISLEWAFIVHDRQIVMRKFRMVLDPQLMNQFINNAEIAPRRVEGVVALFADLRSFSRMCEVFRPEDVSKALNEYLDVVSNCVQSHNGIIDKFVGDQVMALWGAPLGHRDDSLNAVRTAIAIRREIRDLNEQRVLRGDFEIAAGIGIHVGPAIFGPIGNGHRIDITAIGPTINLASRLQSLTKEYQADILISRDLYDRVTESCLVELRGTVSIRGIREKFEIIRLLGATDEGGVLHLHDNILEALELPEFPGQCTNVSGNLASPLYDTTG